MEGERIWQDWEQTSLTVVELRIKKQLECRSIVVFSVMRTVEQGNVLLSGHIQERTPGFAVGLQLRNITTAKLLPFGRVMTEPASQFIAGGHIFEPPIQQEVFFFHTTRPQAVHKEAGPVIRPILAIHTLDPYHDVCLDDSLGSALFYNS